MNCSYPNFHGTDVTPSAPGDALFHVIPVPLEKSVSYGHGTARGPRAILAASSQLELFDGHGVPADLGIFTHAPLPCAGAAEQVLESIAACVGETAAMGKLPVLLGGEHTITLGAVMGLQRAGLDFGVVQFDAHADLRTSYEDDPLSHACVMRRIMEKRVPFAQIGVRALSLSEYELRKEERIPHLDAEVIARGGTADRLLPDGFPESLFITFDIDALDPSIMPATGTPEPGGLGWYQALDLLAAVSRGRTIVGFDVVEFAPVPALHAPDFTAARLVYALMGLAARGRAQSL